MSKQMKSEKRALVPRLRFPEFRGTEDWDMAPLKKLANRRTERNRDGKLTRVLTNSAEHGVVDQRNYFDKDIATQGNLENYFVVKKNDFVYNPRISGFAPVGPISRNRVETGVMSPLYTVFQFKGANTEFYAHYFKSSAWHLYMRKVGSTGARHDRMAISNEDFMAMPLPVPSADEQQKVAGCLSSLDALIAAQVDKIDALKTHKKGLMQQLFPREGETVPRLRFSSNGEWSVSDLPEVAFFQEGPGIMAADFHDEGVPLVRLAGIGGLTVTLNGCNYLDPEKVAQKWSHFRLEVNDLVISTSATFGLSSIVTKATAGAVFYTGLIRFRPRCEKLQLGYLKAFLGSPHFERQSASAAVGGGIKHFGPTHLKQMEIPLPPLAEQYKIADCLSSLDALIAAQTVKLDTLKAHKKGLMQQLFPSPEAVS